MKFVHRVFLLLILFLPLPLVAVDLGDALKNVLTTQNGVGGDEILDPEIAFQLDVVQYSNDQLSLNWQIEEGYYLYKDRFSANSDDQHIALSRINFPAGKLKQDPAFGEVEVYYGQGQASIPFTLSDAEQKQINVEIGYQGCKEDSVCYPPLKKSFSVSLSDIDKPADGNLTRVAAAPLLSEQDSITEKLKNKGLLINILTFFGFGFLLALTPCVFPMIPILSGIIVGEGERITRVRAISLSAVYVLAMALTYAVLGIIAGMFNLNLQAASQNVWILSLFSGVFVLLALSMFGFYELQLPSSWQSKLSSTQGNTERGTLKGAVIMGILSAIIVGPCVAPPLAGALLYISQTGDAVLGGLALFAMGLGFGVPLLLIGATSGELLPRAGAWMQNIKYVFGVIMLGVAIWFMERVLPESIVLILWAALLITTAIFMGALDRMESDSSSWKRLNKGLGLVVLVYGAVLIVAAANGGGKVLQPFKGSSFTNNVATQSLPFEYVASLDELDQRLQLASEQGKPVMLDFYADWCVVCHELENYTYSDPNVQKSLQQFVLLKADVTKNNDSDKALLKQFELFGPPAVLFFNTESSEIKSHRLVGFIKAAPFVQHIEQALAL